MRLFEPLRPRLARFAAATTADREEARDLVAETTLIAYEGFATLRDEKAFLSWLFTIASRLVAKRGIRAKYHGRYDDDAVSRRPDTGSSPETSAEIALLYKALATLPDEQREAVILFEIADLPLKEIAGIQGASLSSVKSRVTRGRQKLSQMLNDAQPQPVTAESDDRRDATETGQNILYMNAA